MEYFNTIFEENDNYPNSNCVIHFIRLPILWLCHKRG